MLIKLGEAIAVTKDDLKLNILDVDDPEITKMFQDTVTDLKARAAVEAAEQSVKTGKAIAPKAKDFLYFTAVMMHAAESALLDDSGALRKTADGKDVEAHWEKRDDTWIWRSSDPDIMPYKNSNCFAPGTDILLGDGSSKKIEDIKVGDEVFTHKNRVRKVVALSSRQHAGTLLKVKSVHNPELLVTGEHPFYKLDASKKKLNNLISHNDGFKFEKAEDLLVGDMLLSPVNRLFKSNDENYRLHRITDIDETDYEGLVYNFAVEDDNSYVANGVIVHNCDIFPEEELKKAYKKWVAKPLCLDHQSQSVDMMRGIVVDTYYDEKKMRVIALCALDKIGYPELAHKVSTGVAASVSMGTAVGRAICTEHGCHRVAKTEVDFCEHMKAKTCYGEINVDLSPIELSIVVSGADPKAKIRRIIAAADSIAQYVEMKENMVKEKQAMTLDEVKQLKEDLKNIEAKITSLGEDENEEIAPPYGQQGRGSLEMAETEVDEVAGNNPQGFPDRYASEILSDIVGVLNEKVAQLDKFINKMASVKESHLNNIEDTTMTNEKKAYFQGGGGVNEPAPGQVKYPKEDSDSIRNNEDKQMVGQPPFPEVGPVDGMHPGPASVPESEEARKKKLQRMAAENEQRKMRREAALEQAKNAINSKQGYFQGGGGVNEPTPGKPKYEKEDSDSIRNNEDKQQVGAPPFPGVGKPDGLYGNDLAEKKKLLRAKLNAQFVKSAEKGSDRWEVYHGDNMILTATVNDLVGPDKVAAFYDSIATKVYGKKILDTIRTQGFDTAMSIFKGAQAVAGPGAAPGAPPEGGAAPTPEMAPPPDMPGDAPVDTGEAGGPAEALETSLDEVDGLIADMKRQVQSLKEEDTGDMGEMAPPEGMTTASVSLPAMRKTLNAALIKGAQQALNDLNDHKEELQLLRHVYNTEGAVNVENSEVVGDLAEEAVNDVKGTVANVHKLMSAFVKYARGTEALIKRAGEESEMTEEAKCKCPGDKCKCGDKECKGCKECKEDKEDKKEDKKEKKDKNDADLGFADLGLPEEGGLEGGLEDEGLPDDPEGLEAYLSELSGDEEPPLEEDEEISVSEEEDIGDANTTIQFEGGEPSELTTDEPVEGLIGEASSDKLAAMRNKIAQKGVAFSDMLQKAHPGGGVTTKLDTKPTGDLGRVETLTEAHDKFMQVANAPPQVRKAAEDIQRLVQAGKIDPEGDFPALIAQGLDPQAVAYWKKLWGEASDSESSQYVNDLVKDYQSKKSEEEMSKYRVKTARAYELAHEMSQRGIIGSNREAISVQVNELMDFSDKNFAHLKATVERYPLKKIASIPNVGYPQDSMMGADLPAVPAVDSSGNLTADLDAAFKGRRY